VYRVTAREEQIFDTYVDVPTDQEDNDPGWPGGPANFLLGETQVLVELRDDIQLTLYFLSDGIRNANDVTVCLPIQKDLIFNAAQDPLEEVVTVVLNEEEITPEDIEFFPPGIPLPTVCTNAIDAGGGAVVVRIGDLPVEAAGFVRFVVEVDDEISP
jgi:hypothetical protein